MYSDSRNGQQHGKLNLISRNAKSSESPDEQRILSNSNILCLIISSPRSHSTITVPPEIQRTAADILIIDQSTAAFTHLEDIQSDKYLGVVLDNAFIQLTRR